MHHTAVLLWAFLSIPLLYGCISVGPDYVRPETPVAQAWHTGMDSGLTAVQTDPARLARWWETLGDPGLTNLMGRAVDNNLDLKQAISRVREARAQRSIAKAGLFPSLDATGSVTRSRGSENTGSGQSRTLYSAGLDAGWELDLFGGVRRSVEAAGADLQASREDLHDVLVSLTAEVGLNYIDLRTYQARLDVAEENLKTREESYELTRERYEAGLTDELDVQQARASLESARAGIPGLRTGMEESMNRLAVLLGVQPGMLHLELGQAKPLPVVPSSVAVGVPADVLRQRPDVRKAERELAAQTARVGVATAELYPKLTLNGSIGLDALNSGKLFTSGARSWSYGPGISWPVFHAGAIRQNIEVQSAMQEQALLTYESSVLGALEEVENALTSYAQEQHRRDSLNEAADAAGRAYEYARIKYEAGLTDFGTLLDAQRSLLSLQDDLATSNGTVTANLVRLYKALGGGWSTHDGTDDPDRQER
ncbi:MAG TPA: efflux transporter outer membrane subunit [Deltaproteobacteria bacterium]|nr:efflux transporter outer membrane subunit [Deltaproteobacteria bacterium]